MKSPKAFFTSESVTEGHPDKLCDQISDGVLDAILAQDPLARVACETATTTGLVLVAGEITTSAWIDMPAVVRKTIEQVGYINADYGFDYRTCGVVISTQHADYIDQEQIRLDVIEHIIKPIVPAHLLDSSTKYLVNPTGRFVTGGPMGDAGLTGRKIIVDTYGGIARHGGGAFSGKDPTKVDRSAAYAARYVAKNIVAAGLADRAELQLSYAIGVARPTSIAVETFGTGRVDDG